MPNPFRFYSLDRFPPEIDRRPYVVARQLRLGDEDAADTEISWREHLTAGDRKLDRLTIQHDTLVDSPGRVPVEIPEIGLTIMNHFDRYIATHFLEAYLTEDKGTLLIEGTGSVVHDAYHTLRDNAEHITISDRKVDFAALAPYLQGVRGAWFSRKTGPLSALGMFGQAVADSPEFADAKVTSDIRSLMVQYEFVSGFRTITITRDGGVIVYQNLDREELLALVFDVYDTLLVHALEPADFTSNRGVPRGLKKA